MNYKMSNKRNKTDYEILNRKSIGSGPSIRHKQNGGSLPLTYLETNLISTNHNRIGRYDTYHRKHDRSSMKRVLLIGSRKDIHVKKRQNDRKAYQLKKEEEGTNRLNVKRQTVNKRKFERDRGIRMASSIKNDQQTQTVSELSIKESKNSNPINKSTILVRDNRVDLEFLLTYRWSQQMYHEKYHIEITAFGLNRTWFMVESGNDKDLTQKRIYMMKHIIQKQTHLNVDGVVGELKNMLHIEFIKRSRIPLLSLLRLGHLLTSGERKTTTTK